MKDNSMYRKSTFTDNVKFHQDDFGYDMTEKEIPNFRKVLRAVHSEDSDEAEEDYCDPLSTYDAPDLTDDEMIHLALCVAGDDLDEALKLADEVFRHKDQPWMSYCVRETLMRWFLSSNAKENDDA